MPSLVEENKYVLEIIEGRTRFLAQYYMKKKSEEPKYLKIWYEDFTVSLRRTTTNTKVCTSNAKDTIPK